MNYTLTYRKNKSQVIYVEEIEKIEESGEKEQQKKQPYFKQEYDEALKLIAEIIELQKNGNEIEVYGCNNRILFTGPRGCGKTSVMRSIANYLSKPEAKLKDKDGNILNVKFEFNCLPMVDPSHFDNNNNILLTVITNMFSEAKRKMNKAGDQGETADREDLLKQFEKVFKSLDSIKSEVQSYTLESLNRKSDAEDLRDKMNQLVAKYLKYLNQGKDAKLVLLIDDIDMSVSHAPGMLEQLRKYLELDNLIILMSANLGQLSNEMREKYSSAFQNTLKDSNQSLSIDVEDLATKYLLKLFPTSRRVNVERHVNQLLQTELIISEATNEDHGNGEKGKERIIVSGDFQKVILSLIWRKTRLLFIPKDPGNTLHPIIPTNLRDLAQFLDMLTDLDDMDDADNENKKLFSDDKAYKTCEKNIQTFKSYVLNTWIPNRLAVDEEKVFENIPTDITEINKHLINSINVIGTKHKTRLMSREVSLDMIERNAENINIDRDIYTMVSPNDPKFVKANKISDIFNQPSNYSYGDLLLMIDKYETYFESEEDRRFTDAIKIYYSILLFENMFFKSNKVKYQKADFDNLDEDERVLPIQKLIGGTVYYPNYFEIITSKHFSQKGPSFDAKRAFYHKVDLQKHGGKFVVGEEYPLFSVLYYGDIRPDRYDTKHIYDTTFKTDADVDGTRFVTFDILSILSNMLNPWHTIERAKGAIAARVDKGNKVFEDYKDSDFDAWKNICKIGSNGIVPNSMLPFYSVDIMLQYLKYSLSFDIFQDEHKEGDVVNVDDKAWKVLVEGEQTKLQGLLAEKDKTKEDESKEISLVGFINAIINLNEEELLRLLNDEVLKDDNANDDQKRISKLLKDEVLKYNVQVLCKAISFYKNIYFLKFDTIDSRMDITDSYRDYVIALILKNIKGSSREKELLIKSLHKYSTSSEITEHLYSVLYKDAFREKNVRKDVQTAVHSNEFVHYYYEKLWINTKRMLDNVTIKKTDQNAGNEPEVVYKEIFDKAIKCFVMPCSDDSGK